MSTQTMLSVTLELADLGVDAVAVLRGAVHLLELASGDGGGVLVLAQVLEFPRLPALDCLRFRVQPPVRALLLLRRSRALRGGLLVGA